jgi:hypothetical protein
MATASILFETDASPDPLLIAAVLARRLGYVQTDGKLAALRARGLLLANIPLDRAAIIVQDLRGMGLPCYCVRDETMPSLPQPRRIAHAEWTEEILKTRASGEKGFEDIPWADVETIAVCLVKSEQHKSVVENVLLPNLPTIHAIDDEEAKKQLRQKLAEISAKRTEVAAEGYVLERTDLEEKHDLVVAKLLDKGSTEGLTAYIDLLVRRGKGEGKRQLRLRVISSEFMFSGLGSAIKGATMENFRALVKEFVAKAGAAKKTRTIEYLFGPPSAAVKATFDTLRQFDSYFKWFLQMDRLGAHPEEFLTGPTPGLETASPDSEASPGRMPSGPEAAVGAPTAPGVSDGTANGTADGTVGWHFLDYALVPLSALGAVPLLEVIRRIASGRIGEEAVFYGAKAYVASVVALLSIAATFGAVIWTFGRGPSWLKRAVLAVLVAVSVVLVMWMYEFNHKEDDMIKQAIRSFVDERRACYRPDSGAGTAQTPEEILNAYFHPSYGCEIASMERSEAEVYATILLEQRFPLRFYLLRVDGEWLVLRVSRSREETVRDPKTGGLKKGVVVDVLYRR